MNMKYRNNRCRGFTLVELLVTIGIIAILVVIVIPRFFAYQDHSRRSVCEANRNMLVRQILYERALDTSYEEADAHDLLTNSDAHCPSGGTYTLQMSGNSVTIACSKHGDIEGSVSGGNPDDTTKTPEGALLTDFWDYIAKKYTSSLNNDIMRRAFFAANGNQWPTIKVNGDTYYIQPFYKTQSDNENIQDRTWLFATTDSGCNNNWSANLVYDVISGKWYSSTNYKGEYAPTKGTNISSYMNIDELHNEVLNGTKSYGGQQVHIWAEVTDVIESPGSWKP